MQLTDDSSNCPSCICFYRLSSVVAPGVLVAPDVPPGGWRSPVCPPTPPGLSEGEAAGRRPLFNNDASSTLRLVIFDMARFQNCEAEKK